MSSNWPRYTVAALQAAGSLLVEDGNHGEQRPRSNEFADEGTYFVRAADMADGRVLFERAERINAVARTRIRKGIGKPLDVLLSHKGTVGKVAFVPINCPDFVCSPQTTFWRVLDHSVLDHQYLFAYLQSREFKIQLDSRKAETDMAPYVSLTAQRQLTVDIPPIGIQQSIGRLLFGIHDRITLLRETNVTLEAIAQALFKSWFVDFDPVRAKQQGQMPEGMDEETAALFPDSFEESELGLVPCGWQSSTVGKSFILTMGQSPPGDTYNEKFNGLPFYQGRTDFGFRFPSQRMYCTAPTRIAEVGDTLVSVRAPVGDVNMAIEKCCIGRGVSSVRSPDGYKSFTFYAMRNLGKKFENFDSEGTIFGSINKKDFEALPVIEPSPRVLAAYDAVAAPIDDRIVESEEQIRILANLRDSLLPRLISGHLRIPEAEAAIEKAAA